MIKVLLSIRGSQAYLDQDPDVIELVTEGTMVKTENGWQLQYQETELTGLAGVTTTFYVQPDKLILTRTGKLRSEMVFQEGVCHDSLYQTEFGTMMLSVCAKSLSYDLNEQGGVIDMCYNIELEQSMAGTVDYHLDIRAK